MIYYILIIYIYACNQLNSISAATFLGCVLFINVNKKRSRLDYLFFFALNKGEEI